MFNEDRPISDDISADSLAHRLGHFVDLIYVEYVLKGRIPPRKVSVCEWGQ